MTQILLIEIIVVSASLHSDCKCEESSESSWGGKPKPKFACVYKTIALDSKKSVSVKILTKTAVPSGSGVSISR